MKRDFNRREFFKLAATGSLAAGIPVWLPACAAGSKNQLLGKSLSDGAHNTYFDSFGVDQGMLARTIQRGLSRGGQFCDIFLQHEISHWLALLDGEVNRAFTSVELGAGIRVLKGDSTGFAYCEDLSEPTLLAAAATAATVADGPVKLRPAPLAAISVRDHYPISVPWTQVGAEKKIPIMRTTDAKVRARDQRIVKVIVNLGDIASHILIANSEGLLCEDTQPMAALMIFCVAQQGQRTEMGQRTISARDGIGFFSAANIERAAHEAADRTTKMFDAVNAPIGELPVVLAPAGSGMLLHEAIGHGMEADFNRKQTSTYAGRIGERVAPKHVTIVDQGVMGRQRGSINVDDEGALPQKTLLVENGVLRSYLHDHISARHYGTQSTGSGRRQSFRFPPLPRMRNTFMLNGPHHPDEIIASVKKGLYAESFTNGEVNIGAGDFTFYLKSGRLIENGKLTRVVKDANLIGNGPKVLECMDMVGDDLDMYSGYSICGKFGQSVPVGYGIPTVRVSAVSVGGRQS